MAKYEQIPGVGLVEFPDDTPPSVIESAKAGKVGVEDSREQTATQEDGSALRTAGVALRGGVSPVTVAGGVGAAGAAAMGAPIAVGAGITALAGGLLELGARAYNSEIAKQYGVRGEDAEKVKLPSEYLNQIKDLIGLPKAETRGERIVEAGAEMAGESLATIGAGQALTAIKQAPRAVKALGGLLQAQPKMQIAGGATGGMAQEAAEEAGVGPIGQTIAGVGGSVAPSAPGLLRAGLTSTARGFATPQQILENIGIMKGAGTEATLGQATGSRPLQILESGLETLPGSNPIMASQAAAQQSQIGSKVEQIAAELAPGATELSAGSKISRGIKDVFLPEARKEQNRLYGLVDQYIPKGSEVDVSNTKALLNEISAPIPGMTATSETSLVNNKVINELTSGLNIDTALGGGVPIGGIRELRSRIGEKLGQFQMDSNFPRAELKRLYGALTKDIEVAVNNAGPKAVKAFNEANTYTKQLHDKIDLLQPIIDKATPEKIFTAAMGGQKADTTILRTVVDALPQDAKRELSAAFLKKMGRAVSSGQSSAGDVFSTETFLTNWDKLRGAPKEILFGNYGDSFKKDMDNIVKATDIIRSSSKGLVNYSRTAKQLVIGGSIMALFTAPETLLPVAGGLAISNLAARALTNPKFVRALANKYDAPQSALPSFITTIVNQAERDDDQDLMEIADGLKKQSIESELKR